jgi:hypothetical protein
MFPVRGAREDWVVVCWRGSSRSSRLALGEGVSFILFSLVSMKLRIGVKQEYNPYHHPDLSDHRHLRHEASCNVRRGWTRTPWRFGGTVLSPLDC